MIPGFNHNIKHNGRVYHIQTEDSGRKNPHIITHLFVGGNILASTKTGYAELVDQPGYEDQVRRLMEEQHKTMLRNLIHGKYDHVQTGAVHHLDGPAPLNVDPANVSPATAMMAGAAAHTERPSEAPAQSASPQVAQPAGAVPAPLDLPDVASHKAPAPPVPQAADPAPEAPAASSAPVDPMPQREAFGQNIISDKPLDEVVLRYLEEDGSDPE